jgi:hypothetical protein
MKPGIIYRGDFYNEQVDGSNQGNQQIIRVDIFDTEVLIHDEDQEEIVDLSMAGKPLSIKIVDNEETKNGVKSKRAEIRVQTSSAINIHTFVNGGDTRYKVVVANNSLIDFYTFTGWLSVSDISEEFQPNPNELVLIATDGLGFLADEPLTDADGNTPTNEKSFGSLVYWALLKTGLDLPINVVFNIREENATPLNADSDGSGHFYVYNYLNSKTHEADIGECEDSRTVLEKIMGKMCYLVQYMSEWWIVRIDEVQYLDEYKVARFSGGEFVSYSTTTPSKSIGVGLPLAFMNDDAIVSAERPIKDLILKYLFETWKEIPCNSEFSRGTGSEPTGAANETIDYTLECWKFLREGVSNIDLDTAPFAGSVGLLRKRFEYNYEKERYLVTQVAGGFRHYFKSEGVQMDNQAKITVAFNWRTNTELGDVNVNVAHVRFIGSSGQIYDWDRPAGGSPSWSAKANTDPVFVDTLQVSATGQNTVEWQSASFESQPVPEAGTLYIRLLNDLASPTERHFSGLQITYTPLRNGSYATYTGQQERITQEGNYKSKIEEQIYIGQPPSINDKGAILKRGADLEIYDGLVDFGSNEIQISGDHRGIFDVGGSYVVTGSGSGNDSDIVISAISYSLIGNLTHIVTDQSYTTEIGADVVISKKTFVLAGNFYSAAVLPDGPTPETLHPYGHLQAFDIWNQNNRTMYKFEGTIDGLDSNTDFPDIIHKFFMTDIDDATNNKIFAALHFDQDYNLCSWEGFFHELHDNTISKQYTGHTFKYTSKDE